MKYNVILDTDSYKFSHWQVYDTSVRKAHFYIEARKSPFQKIVFSGLQIFLKNLVENPITMEMIDEAESYIKDHGFTFNRAGWERIVEKHGGNLPIQIQALPEGTIVSSGIPMVQVVNTDEEFAWLPGFLETAILRAVWYPTTVSTISHEIVYETIAKFHDETVGNRGLVPFSLHDFGSRGVSSRESAGIGGVAHLFNSMGTDTVESLIYARKYYNEPMAGFSIPAAEHSIAMQYGKNNEAEYARTMLNNTNGPLVAVVSDTYDIFNMVENIWCGELLEEVKKSGRKVVIRPDSGNPVEVIKRIFSIFDEKLRKDITINDKGYKQLPPYFGVIQGDGVNSESIREILKTLEIRGWASNNIVFGMGGALLQKCNRDTLSFAYKESAILRNGEWEGVVKAPVTDPGKVSKEGIFSVFLNEDGKTFYKNRISEHENFYTLSSEKDLMVVKFFNGKLLYEETLSAIRERVSKA